MFRRKRSADTGMTTNVEMPDSAYETDFVDTPPAGKPMSRRERRAAEKAAKRETMEAAKRQSARRKVAAKHKATAKKKGLKKKPQSREQNKRAISAQATIPYREMGKDGICRVHDRLYSKTIRYLDLNYQLAQPDDKADISKSSPPSCPTRCWPSSSTWIGIWSSPCTFSPSSRAPPSRW